jgi:hypothetical protein
VSNAVFRILSLTTTIVATKVASDVASRTWKLTTGRSVPVKGDFEGERTRDVVAYTALSSMLVMSARVAAERKVAEYYRQSTGHLPSALSDARLSRKERRQYRRLQRATGRVTEGAKQAVEKITP